MGMVITNKHKKAALLVAQGYLSLKQIADECQIARQTLIHWKQKAEFKALVMNYNEPLMDMEVREKNLLDAAYRALQMVMENSVNDGAKVNAAKYVIDVFRNNKGTVNGKTALDNNEEMNNILKLVKDEQ